MEMALIIGIAILIIIVIIAFILKKPSESPQSTFKYQKRAGFLTQNELKFYTALTKTRISLNYAIFAKVRLSDLIEPTKGSKNWQASFNKIKAKHIDFLLCDKSSIKPVIAIELDDSSHNKPNRQARDEFVDQALQSAEIPILHTKNSDKLEENIMALLSPKKTVAKK